MKKIFKLFAILAVCILLSGCREADMVRYNVSKEADNFNVTRRLTVINARTDTILLQLTGTFSLKNNSQANELEIICETEGGSYQKHFVYLNDYTIYIVEDISNTDVDKYHYELNFLPQMLTGAPIAGTTVTISD